MKQSEHDPTLKEHFTENEARNWIRHLEKVIEQREQRLMRTKSKNKNLFDSRARLYRKFRRLLARMEFLQEQHPEIDFGLKDFSKDQEE